jgi:hypothetical protein
MNHVIPIHFYFLPFDAVYQHFELLYILFYFLFLILFIGPLWRNDLNLFIILNLKYKIY